MSSLIWFLWFFWFLLLTKQTKETIETHEICNLQCIYVYFLGAPIKGEEAPL